MQADIKKWISSGRGLEIGGPSKIFNDSSLFPVYRSLTSLDGINFSEKTIWENHIIEGEGHYGYRQGTPAGYQYIGEAQALPIPDETYDVVLSSHSLEHSANPIKVLEETKRVLKKGGVCLYILPAKEGTFDHRREVTKLAHLIDDYQRNVQEDDMTHLAEILSLHDLSRDLAAGTFEQFTRRSLKNFENRGLHQHVFDRALLQSCFEHVGMEVLSYQYYAPIHHAMLARKSL